MKVLTEFRTNKQGDYAPSPVAAGLALIWIGLGLIAGQVRRMPKRMFYTVQAALVWQWFGERNYTNDVACLAWLSTALCFGGTLFWVWAIKTIIS